MFVAYNKVGVSINIAEKKWSRSELVKLRESTTFTCPICSSELELKIGTIITAHFAHKKLTGCTLQSESESHYHLKGKLDLYKWFLIQKKFSSVQLEPYLNGIKQRPDILASNHIDIIPTEYQCSTIDSRVFIKRTKQYLAANMKVFWVLGAKTLRRIGSTTFSLSPFQWLFAVNTNNGDPPRIFTYCSESKTFIVLHSIIPFSSRMIYANLLQLSPNAITFDELKNQKLINHQVYSAWFDQLKRFRLKPTNFKTREAKHFNLYLYQNKHLPLSFLPSIAFLPLKTTYLIESAVYVWQGWILLYIDAIPISQAFTFKCVYKYIDQKVNSKKITIRQLPQINLHYSYVIKEYLNELSKCKILKKLNENTYSKVTDIHWTTHIEDLLQNDDRIKRAFMFIKE